MRPTTSMLVLVGGWFAFSLFIAFVPALVPGWTFASASIVAVTLLDALLLLRMPAIRVERRVAANLPIGARSTVELLLETESPSRASFDVFDHVPPTFDADGQPAHLTLEAGKIARLSYGVRPTRRGDARFAGVDMLLLSPLRLWRRRRFIPLESHVRVYPNFAEVAHYALLARADNLSQFGIRRQQRRGEGSDFLQLREYRRGDSFRQVDWKATSKRNRLISREYHEERDQQLVFLVDCGRAMRSVDADQSHLDQALNAMLLLGHVATRQGDAVGFLSFAGARRWVKPDKGSKAVTRLLGQCYGLDTTTDPADYLAAARTLQELQRRRALVVILSNTRTEDVDDLKQAILVLRRRHLVVLADLQEPGLDAAIKARIRGLDDALTFHSALNYLDERKRHHEQLSHSGAICIDTPATALPVRLVNRYLDIKRTGAL